MIVVTTVISVIVITTTILLNILSTINQVSTLSLGSAHHRTALYKMHMMKVVAGRFVV